MDCDVTYEVRYGIRGSYSAIAQNTISSVEFSRRLDDISKATIRHVITDTSCCDDLARIEPWADTVEILRNGSIVWMGWVTGVEYTRDTVSVEASDALVWARYRILDDDYDKTQDSVYHFRDIWNLIMSPNPLPITVNTSLTGVVEKRKYSKDYRRAGWFILKEMIEGSLDVYALGTTIYAGALNVSGIINLNDDDFSGDITIRKAGEMFANQIVVEGARQVAGTYPDGNVTGDGVYPLVQDIVYDEAITSIASAQAQAKSRYEFTSGIVPRIVRAGDALTLRQGAVELSQLIPSRIISLTTTITCLQSTQQFRLGGVDVSFAGGNETVGVSLQPIGTLASLEGITADDDRGAVVDV